jgi:hypothetical protein
MMPHDVKSKMCEFLREFSFLEIFVKRTKLVTTQVLGSQAMGKGEPSKTADMAASRERPCLRMVER